MKALELTEGLRSRAPKLQRRSMAKAITLLESTRAEHRVEADLLLSVLQGEGVSAPQNTSSQAAFFDTLRVGISGSPGVGKSTFIESLGLALIARGHRVAVLAVDPSSSLSGGSIMGDKTRMEHLSVHPQAFVRPSPSAGNLGGVCEKTRECMMVCEFSGYDVILVETVGVGQSEVAVANMTDVFLLLQLPNAGDDLQAMKKGVMEFADFVAINKCDLDAEAATRAQASMLSTLRLMESSRWVHPGVTDLHASMAWVASNGGEGMGDLEAGGGGIDPALDTQPKAHEQNGAAHQVRESFPIEARVHQISALKGDGVQGLMDGLFAHRQWSQGLALWAQKRQAQSRAWLWERVYSGLRSSFLDSLAVKNELPQVLVDVERGVLAPSTAARRLLGLFRGGDAVRAADSGSPH